MASLTTESTQTGKQPGAPKRLIVCIDGTWMDSLGKKSFEPPSNVTRISRGFCRTCSDGTHQIISYHRGVGTANAIDQITGGAFGMGLDGDIREAYNFICTNYVDGDDIILLGFSRGAFTARSTADMIASIGLLTPEGLDNFYRIFEDYENMGDKTRDTDEYLVRGLPEYNGSHGAAKVQWEVDRMRRYKEGLKALKYTRDRFNDNTTEIKIRALAVWDTVGTLGIPPAPVIGVRGSADQWRFTNTQISDHVEYAFQALGLDEPRYAFRPSLWERAVSSKTKLKQVWFPGSHANIGGGWPDQQMANITLAWMCDQLATLGVEFNFARMTSIFIQGLRFSAAHPFPFAPAPSRTAAGLSKLFRKGSSSSSAASSSEDPRPWASDPLFHHPFAPPKRDEVECDGKDKHPDLPPNGDVTGLWQFARPWALGMIRSPPAGVQTWAGKTVRRPGLSLRVDEDTNEDTKEPLVGTAETIHSSVRVRLACGGLGLDDRDVWTCDSLLRGDEKYGDGPLWRLERTSPSGQRAPLPREINIPGGEYPASVMYPVGDDDGAWQWVWTAKIQGSGADQIPQAPVLHEEPLTGFWERYLLKLLAGDPDVWKYAFRGLPLAVQEAPPAPPVKQSKRASFIGALTK